MGWDPPAVARDQLVLFSDCLDEVLPSDHPVRRLDEVLDRLDWSAWEAEYKHDTSGRPPIHPRVKSGVILYGLLRGVRSSRALQNSSKRCDCKKSRHCEAAGRSSLRVMLQKISRAKRMISLRNK